MSMEDSLHFFPLEKKGHLFTQSSYWSEVLIPGVEGPSLAPSTMLENLNGGGMAERKRGIWEAPYH